MPSRKKSPAPAARSPRTTTTPDQQEGGNVEADLALPHERDQSSHMTDGIPSSKVRQASKDVERGLQDTSKSVEMDRAYQKQR